MQAVKRGRVDDVLHLLNHGKQTSVGPTKLDPTTGTTACVFLLITYSRVLFLLKGKGSPYSITERRVPELVPVLGSEPAGDVSHKPGGRQPLLSARTAVTPATIKTAATSFAAW